MIKKYKILTEFAKDVSYEVPNVETYLETKDNKSIKYSKKIVKSTLEEIQLHKIFLKNEFKKNFF